MKAQNEVMAQIVDQNNQLIAQFVSDDEVEQDDGYLSG